MKKITPTIVGQYLGISAQAVREGMEDGSLPIGFVEKTSNGRTRFIILPKMLYDITGVKLNGYEPEPTINIDYTKLANSLAKALVDRFMEAK